MNGRNRTNRCWCERYESYEQVTVCIVWLYGLCGSYGQVLMLRSLYESCGQVDADVCCMSCMNRTNGCC